MHPEDSSEQIREKKSRCRIVVLSMYYPCLLARSFAHFLCYNLKQPVSAKSIV